jgi:hypothetical protein
MTQEDIRNAYEAGKKSYESSSSRWPLWIGLLISFFVADRLTRHYGLSWLDHACILFATLLVVVTLVKLGQRFFAKLSHHE